MRRDDTLQRVSIGDAAQSSVSLYPVCRSLDVPVSEDTTRPHNPQVDLVVWRQVARSSMLALFDWLVKDASNRPMSAATWAQRTCDTAFDFATFTKETSLGSDDARLAVEMSAHGLVQSGLLNPPQPLWYRGTTVFASAGEIWCMTTRFQPMLWLPLTGSERPIVRQDDDIVSVRLPNATAVDLVPLTPWVGVQQSGQQLIVGPSVQAQSQTESIMKGIAVTIDDGCRSVMTANGLRIACHTPGTLSFSAPRNALTSYDHGFLLEWNVVEHGR